MANNATVSLHFIKSLGMKTLFPIFMGKYTKTLKKEYKKQFSDLVDDGIKYD